MIYLDSSAIVKLVVRERESTALRRFLRSYRDRISCSLAGTEVPRAVRHL
jgi:predicted nucleic acid-binding protein